MLPSRMTTVKNLLHSFFPPPPPIQKSKNRHSQNEDHYKNSTKPDPAGLEAQRCQFTFSDGRQCRNQRAHLCIHHSSKEQRDFGAAGAPDAALVGLCADLTTATNINRALAQAFLLMAQGPVPQKQAVAFGYLSQLLLQTVPGIRSEYVSVFGYAAWETNLKSKITSLLPPTAQPEPPAPAPPPATPSPDSTSLLPRSPDLLDLTSVPTPEGRRD